MKAYSSTGIGTFSRVTSEAVGQDKDAIMVKAKRLG